MTEADFVSQRIARAVTAVRACSALQPSVGVVLGSGLGAFADTLRSATDVAYAQIDGMAATHVAGHAGKLVLGTHGALPVAALSGRVHLYEGHAPERVVSGVRLLIGLNARTIILTNAASAIREDFRAGDLMLIEDHLNLTGQNCLVGANDDAIGPRF